MTHMHQSLKSIINFNVFGNAVSPLSVHLRSSGLIIGSFHAVTVNRQNFQTLRMRFGFRFGHLYRDCLRIFCNYIRQLYPTTLSLRTRS